MILGGLDRLPTGELVPRRTAAHARNVSTLSLLAQAGGVELGDPPWSPPWILFEPTELWLAERELAAV